jgi:hypothetical protein
MDHADWSAALRAKIVRLRDVADNASDEEVMEVLREIATERENELGFIDRKYG